MHGFGMVKQVQVHSDLFYQKTFGYLGFIKFTQIMNTQDAYLSLVVNRFTNVLFLG